MINDRTILFTIVVSEPYDLQPQHKANKSNTSHPCYTSSFVPDRGVLLCISGYIWILDIYGHVFVRAICHLIPIAPRNPVFSIRSWKLLNLALPGVAVASMAF